MPIFKTQPSANLRTAIMNAARSGGFGGARLSAEDEEAIDLKASTHAADIGYKNALAEKARGEFQIARDKQAAAEAAERRRRDPMLRTEYAAMGSGMNIPDATRLAGAIRGEYEQPSAADMADAGAVGADAVPYPMQEPNADPGQKRLFRALMTAVQGLDFATGPTNAEQLAKAGGEHQANAVSAAIQEEIARGNYLGASAMNQGAKPGTAIKLHENVGNTGATFAPATGVVAADPKAQPGNTLLARTLATAAAEEQQRRGAAAASTAAAEASRAHAGLYTAQAENERRGGTQGRPPAGFRWGPPDAAGNPTLVKITGGPAEDKATSSDAERIAAGYATRMDAAAAILADLEAKGIGKPGMVESAARATGSEIGANVAQSPDRQKYRQAQEDWVRAKLRKESGAVIADEEMEREIRVYFPQIGDSEAVLKQKRDARKVAEGAMKQAAGRAAPKDGAALSATTGQVQARKKIGNVEFVKIDGVWHQP